MSLANQRPHTNMSLETANKTYGCVLFSKTPVKAVWGCVDQTASLNSCGAVDFACTSGWSNCLRARGQLVRHTLFTGKALIHHR